MYEYVNMLKYTYAHVSMHFCDCVCVCVHVHAFARMHTCARTCVCSFTAGKREGGGERISSCLLFTVGLFEIISVYLMIQYNLIILTMMMNFMVTMR
jgi:hypothetical protein